MNIKIINAGKCMMCGNEIKLVTNKNYDKLPEIFFCPKCSRKINNKDHSKERDVIDIMKMCERSTKALEDYIINSSLAESKELFEDKENKNE